MTGFGTVETAIEAMKKGAYDYILKPFKIEEVVHVVERGLDRQRLQAENIRLKEAVSLYKISEAIAQSLSLDTVLDLILDARARRGRRPTSRRCSCKDPRSGLFVERIAHATAPNVDGGFVGELNLGEVLEHYRARRAAPRARHAGAASSSPSRPRTSGWSSFCSIPLKVQDRVIGMLNAYSYTRGNKFAEGQRKMLSVLASRAAVSIENARLYEDLVQQERAT